MRARPRRGAGRRARARARAGTHRPVRLPGRGGRDLQPAEARLADVLAAPRAAAVALDLRLERAGARALRLAARLEERVGAEEEQDDERGEDHAACDGEDRLRERRDRVAVQDAEEDGLDRMWTGQLYVTIRESHSRRGATYPKDHLAHGLQHGKGAEHLPGIGLAARLEDAERETVHRGHEAGPERVQGGRGDEEGLAGCGARIRGRERHERVPDEVDKEGPADERYVEAHLLREGCRVRLAGDRTRDGRRGRLGLGLEREDDDWDDNISGGAWCQVGYCDSQGRTKSKCNAREKPMAEM